MRTVLASKLTMTLIGTLLVGLLAAACSGTTTETANDQTDAEDRAEAPADRETPDLDPPDPAAPELDAEQPEPVPHRPTGPVGDAAAYDELIAELESHVPTELRGQVPWPDLRNPDPAKVQVEIFDLWIWMNENHPEPLLAPAMAVEGSDSREQIAAVFGVIKADDELHIREGAPYVAFDHRVFTFESAGLPLWLARDVPEDAVVVYYQDQSGPVSVRDRSTNELLGLNPGAGARQWLSIMVPTDVGWLLFRDELIEPGDAELEVPESAPPSTDATDRRTNV